MQGLKWLSSMGEWWGEWQQKYRQYPPRVRGMLVVLLCGWAVFQLYYTTLGAISAMNLRACHALFLLAFTFILWPGCSRESRRRILPPWWDLLLICAAVLSLGYVMLNYPRVAMSGGRLALQDLIVAGVLLLLVFEAARRACPNLALLAALFLAYNFVGVYLPGALGHNGLSFKRVLSTQIWGTQGVLGIGCGVSATYIFVFVLFGSFLKYSGFSRFINNLALSLVGRSPGGPAKVAVLASAAMGMVNGSAIANVATTGTITIPLMKQTGYRREFAAAVEAVSSTGGQFCPPIMGAVGFVMAEFLNLSYTRVMLAAVIPALLYYLGLLAAVHFEAKKSGLKGFSPDRIPSALAVIKSEGHLAVPLLFLIVMMCAGYTPLYAAVLSIAVTVLVSALKPQTRMSFEMVIRAVVEGARGAIAVGICCVIIGVIIGTVTLTSLGLNMGYVILSVVEEGNLYLTGFFTMLMSVILGMGVPGVAAYVIVQAVAVPVLLKAGVVPLCAHLFCLIYACLSNITPPVAMSCYVAAGIAESNQLKTGMIAVKLGLVGFILPFFFLHNPILLLGVQEVPALTCLWTALTACLGTVALAAALQGYLIRNCGMPERLMLLAVCPCLLNPGGVSDAVGLSLFAGILLWQYYKPVRISKLNS